MAKYTTGYTLGITKEQLLAVQLRANGVSTKEIASRVFDVRGDDGKVDENKLRKRIALVRKWFKDPKIQNAYREILREFIQETYPRAFLRLAKQIDDGNGWIAQNAANAIINKFSEAVFGEEDKKVVIQFEGLPDLGTPEE